MVGLSGGDDDAVWARAAGSGLGRGNNVVGHVQLVDCRVGKSCGVVGGLGGDGEWGSESGHEFNANVAGIFDDGDSRVDGLGGDGSVRGDLGRINGMELVDATGLVGGRKWGKGLDGSGVD